MSENMSEIGVIEALVTKYEALRGQYDEMEKATKELKAQKDAAEKEIISALLDMAEKTGVDDLTVKVGVYKYAASVKDYFSITNAEKDEAYPLLRELGLGDLIVEKVDDRTLSSQLREIMETYRAANPESTEQFPAEYEPLLIHLNRFPKATLARRKA